MAEWKRVRWIGLKPARESTIAAHRFDPEKHTALDKPATDERGEPLPVKFHTTVDEAAAEKKARRRPKKAAAKAAAPDSPAASAEAPADDGHQASETEENN